MTNQRRLSFFSEKLQNELEIATFIPFHRLFLNQQRPMSQHNSFKVGAAAGQKKRNVLKRFERVDLLKKRGQWSEGDRVVGLRKTKPIV